jgi:6-phosphogluconolactonase (cycloisomerase 2 family)
MSATRTTAPVSVRSRPTGTAFLITSPPSDPRPSLTGRPHPCWVEISHDGTYLFTDNTGSGTISSYAIKRDGSLVLIGSFAIKGGGASIDARLSLDGKYLLVNGPGPHFVSVFAVNGGNLTEVPSSPTPLPAGATSSSGIVNT